MTFSSDGQRIVSGDTDGALRFWSSPASWTDALCAELTQNISHQQGRDLVSPALNYIEACPGSPIPPEAGAR